MQYARWLCTPKDSGRPSAPDTPALHSAHRAQTKYPRFKYFVEHTYSPKDNCMVFHLDYSRHYSRRSDLRPLDSARRLHGGYMVVTRRLHGGYMVVTWWLHGARRARRFDTFVTM